MQATEQKRYTNEVIKHEFTKEEKFEIAADMAHKVDELSAAEDRKKEIASQIKSEIDALTAAVNLAARKLNNGYEMRDVKCELVPDYRARIWRFVRTDTGEVLAKTKRMTEEEAQMKVFSGECEVEA